MKQKTSDRSVLIQELKSKAEKFKGTIKIVTSEEMKEKLRKERELLVSIDDYVKTGIHLGTKVITPDMKPFVFRRRADSIGVLNTSMIDENIKKAIKLMSEYAPEDIIFVCKKESGRKSAKEIGELLGIKAFTNKYPGGLMTNIQLDNFCDPSLVVISDAWIDRNALKDAKKMNKKVILLCDTNNYSKEADCIIPCNNKGEKSLALVFYLLAKGYIENRKINQQLPPMKEFIGYDEQEV